jgi:hypothetical protein
MQDPIAIALKRRAQTALAFGLESPTCLVGAHGKRRQRPVFLIADLGLEGVGDSSY